MDANAKNTFFLPYQREWIRDGARIKLMEKSRQIGMSWCSAYSIVRRHSLSICSLDTWVSSRDELQSKLFVQDCKKFSEILGVAMRMISGSDFLRDSCENTLEFVNGTRVWSLSSNPDAQAGKRGDRILDEFALHPDPERLYSIAFPGITWGGNLEIISTHRGADNFFNKLVEEARFGGNPKKISLHRVTLQDALEQGLLKKLKEKSPENSEIFSLDEAAYFDRIKNSCASREAFMQEYMCEPFDDNSCFISHAILSTCLYRDNEKWQCYSDKSNDLYLGVDVARSRDLSVFWLCEKIGDTLYTREILTFKDTPFFQQEAALHVFLRLPNLRRCCIDRSGLGRQFSERAESRYGSSRVEGVSFTQSIKEELAYPLRTLFEQARLRIPDSPDILADICSVRRESTRAGNVRIDSAHSENGHSDRFWALALCVRASVNSFGSGEMTLIPASKNDNFVW